MLLDSIQKTTYWFSHIPLCLKYCTIPLFDIICGKLFNSSPNCVVDPSIEKYIIFYCNIVTATDSAVHIGTDTCHVVMVPKCNKKYKKSKN